MKHLKSTGSAPAPRKDKGAEALAKAERKARKAAKKAEKKKKPKKSPTRRLFGEAFDLLDDIFD